MSEDTRKAEEIFKRLENNYPMSFALLSRIATNFTEIYEDVNRDAQFKQGETKEVNFGIGVDNEGAPRLAMGENATIFYTAIVYTIFEAITRIMLPDKKMEDIEKEFIRDNKICPDAKCGEINKVSAESCMKCGTKL